MADLSIIQDTIDSNAAQLGDATDLEKRIGQSFTFSESALVTGVVLRIDSTSGSPTGNITARIETNSSGLPSGTLAHANASKVFTPIDEVNTITFDSSFTLSADTYHLIFLCDNQSTGVRWNVGMSAGSTYANGTRLTSSDGGSTWSTTTGDLTFRVTAETPPSSSSSSSSQSSSSSSSSSLSSSSSSRSSSSSSSSSSRSSSSSSSSRSSSSSSSSSSISSSSSSSGSSSSSSSWSHSSSSYSSSSSSRSSSSSSSGSPREDVPLNFYSRSMNVFAIDNPVNFYSRSIFI